jgi:asparagine synthase (glutamine-hydrolysing)
MCGFVGWFDLNPKSADVLIAMNETLSHRGPNAAGYFIKGPVAMGHRRLSVIDLESSVQPMTSLCGRYTLVFNGEIYNFLTLKTELQSLGCHFRTEGDTEVLLNALIAWKAAAINKLEGMFAFAFWDEKEKTFLLARDHAGIKPLYYAYEGERLIFGSEIKALLSHPDLDSSLDTEALGLFLECQFIPAPLSIFKTIKKLPPAHSLTFNQQKFSIQPYWVPSYEPKIESSEKDVIKKVEEALLASVESMLVADVPIGAFISGGIDSSLIAAMMTKISGKKTDLFTLGYKDAYKEDETSYAKQVADHLGAHHHSYLMTPEELLKELEEWNHVFDEPFGDQAALPTMILSKFASKHVTCILSGEGADEVFAGYSNYEKRLHENPLSKWLSNPISLFPSIYPLLPYKLRKEMFLKTASRPVSKRYTTIPQLFDQEAKHHVFSKSFQKKRKLYLEDFAQKHFHDCNSVSYLDKMLHIDQNLWLPDDLLVKVDRATMRYSLEARVPFLDRSVMQLGASIKAEHKLHQGCGKYIIKKVAKKYLPDHIVFRPKKGFVLPLDQWIKKELKPLLHETISEKGLLNRGIFNPKALISLRDDQSGKQATRLFSLIMLEKWFQKYAPDFSINEYV